MNLALLLINPYFICQKCEMKFGTWTYDGGQVFLRHIDQDDPNTNPIVEVGLDLSEFFLTMEFSSTLGTYCRGRFARQSEDCRCIQSTS